MDKALYLDLAKYDLWPCLPIPTAISISISDLGVVYHVVVFGFIFQELDLHFYIFIITAGFCGDLLSVWGDGRDIAQLIWLGPVTTSARYKMDIYAICSTVMLFSIFTYGTYRTIHVQSQNQILTACLSLYCKVSHSFYMLTAHFIIRPLSFSSKIQPPN